MPEVPGESSLEATQESSLHPVSPFIKVSLFNRYHDYVNSYSQSAPDASYSIDGIKTMLFDNWETVSLYHNPSQEEIPENLIAITWLKERNYRQQIPDKEWENLDMDTMKKVNQFLLSAYNNALQIYPWQYPQKGLLISGDWRFEMAVSNVPEHIIFSFDHAIRPIIDVIQTNDRDAIERFHIHISASIVHELTHIERNDEAGSVHDWEDEVISHAVEFLYDPKGNIFTKKQIVRILNRIKQRRDQPGTLEDDLDNEEKRIIDKTRYVSLLFIADFLAKNNSNLQSLLDQDTDPNKLNALRDLLQVLNTNDLNFLHTYVIEILMKLPRNQIEIAYKKISNKYSINQDAVKIAEMS